MILPRLLALAALPLLGTVAASGPALGSSPPLPWGSDGHRMASRAAHSILPDGMPAFFRAAGEHLEYLGPEPDRWRYGALREMDEAWRYDHYIDMENVPPGALQASDRFDFISRLHQAGIQRPQQTVGFLPFRILEIYQRLTVSFARWRLAPGEPRRSWVEERVLNDAGLLGHYAVDASQPHHTTIHFNGWAEDAPNPRGYTTDRGFHHRFETAFVRAHLRLADLEALVPPEPQTLGDVRAEVWAHIQEGHDTVERLYELEKRHGFPARGRPHPETVDFAARRLANGAEMLASLWWTAWLRSEEVAEDLRQLEWMP